MCVAAAAAVISVWLWAMRPELAHYRGLSGIDSALLFVVGIFLLRCAVGSRDRPTALAAAGLLVAVSLKSLLEMVARSPLVVADGTSFTPILQTHWLGGAAGIVVALFRLTKDHSMVPLPKRAPEL